MPVIAIRSLEDLNRFRQEALEAKTHKTRGDVVHVVVGLGSCGIAAGALDVYNTIQEQIKAGKMKDVYLSKTGCIGKCRDEPILAVITGEDQKVCYGKVTPEAARLIFNEHVLDGKVVKEYLIEPC